MKEVKSTTRRSLTVRMLVAAAVTVCAVTSYAAGPANLGPVVLYIDSTSSPFTLNVRSKGSSAYSVTRRAVAASEIAAMQSEGYEVVFQEDPSQSTAGPKSLVGSIPSSFNIIRRFGVVYGVLWTSGTRPSGKTTQWLVFNYSSQAYSGEHVPLALFLDASKLAGSSPAIVGNGMIIGDVHLRSTADGGCGSTSWPSVPIYNAQVEAYWSTNNWIYGGTCLTSGVQDGPTYNFTMHANINSWVAFWTPTQAPPAAYTLTQNPSFDPNNGGVLFSTTNDNPSRGDFNLHFTNVSTGWF